jgi:thiamine-phosphate pyrophosphorylase
VAGIALILALAHEGPPVPWFAIGGVTLETVIAASGYAVVRAVLDAEDPQAARELRSLLE